MLINNKYKLLSVLGQGDFGLVYKGKNIRTDVEVAIKVEPIIYDLKLLKNEANIYIYLKNVVGIPIVKWYGKDDINYYMVLELLGNSLKGIVNKMRVLSFQVICQIIVKVIDIIRSIHEMGILHRDIKPENLLFGLGDNCDKLYLIDFGLSKSYISLDNQHISFIKTSGLIGSSRYASVNAHDFNQLSRRDDLETVFYILLLLLYGTLEWDNLDSKKDNLHIRNLKKKSANCTTIPKVYIDYITYVKKLEFNDRPDYTYLLELFSNMLC